MAFALNGLGGAGCTPGGSDPATSTAGVGPCQWFNPFSEAIHYSATKGVVNPTFQPAVANSQGPDQWLTLEGSGREINELLVWDVVFDERHSASSCGVATSVGPAASRRETKSTRPN